MDSIFVFAILFLLALVLCAILGFVAWLRSGDLRDRINRLEAEVAKLKAAPPAASAQAAAPREAPSGPPRETSAEPPR
ncbi:hypothetical protein [Breoghania sp. L-A4]|uniref:hypothetical protein n=1 Tax=Breoghania sp. L-A4 TaxID=2304600 RepID=UPI000E3583A8|nr:hypothetical protein [Breoghania sp. L-A4]AXS39554.1 hypothetical protein D1F64_05175 [Breoghania sp. L-A4]